MRELLQTELLEEIARNTAQISPGFDLTQYQKSLQCSYGYLKLYTLDPTYQIDHIKLWRMFIEQTVREALPPTRYDLPLDLKRKLQAEGKLGDDVSPEALQHHRRQYFQQPTRKVLEAVADSQKAVILGDPGAGKSTLLQYLALEWVERKTEILPLLIELREYVLAESRDFLDFLHQGRGADWQFDQHQLHQHLLDNLTLVMFDGLDEVFDRATQSAVIDDIIRFSQQYPQAQVLVTSRIIGYNPDRFQQAEFRQFTIEPLNEAEIHEFIERWYDLAMGSDPDKVRLKQRLNDLIANFKAIQNLADNPLLLTMMAILNRRQELPRDRTELYDEASRVLLYHWDVDHKRLKLPLDTIGRREKQEMLRRVAYEMQAGDEGLKGNLISADRLTKILTDYLRDQGFSEPREKAHRLIQQLRERNFILCYRGADTYGFVHRTFLEYFCAVEIVWKFEKERLLSEDDLVQVYADHWRDETWHEVLRLMAGMLNAKFVGKVLEYLMEQEGETEKFLNVFLAAECLAEVRTRHLVTKIAHELLTRIEALTRYDLHYYYDWSDQEETKLVRDIRTKAVRTIANAWKERPETLTWLKTRATTDEDWRVRGAAVKELARAYKDDLDTLTILKTRATTDEDGYVRRVAVEILARHHKHDPNTLIWIKTLAQTDENWAIRRAAIQILARHHKHDPETLTILKTRATTDEHWGVRRTAIQILARTCKDDPGLLELFCDRALNDPFEGEEEWQYNPRQTALEAIVRNYPNHPQTLPLLRDCAQNDPDEQLREWAQQELKRIERQK